MITVIKYGKQFATCDKCYSVIEFENEDVGMIQTGINECDRVVKCPVRENQIKEIYWKKDINFR